MAHLFHRTLFTFLIISVSLNYFSYAQESKIAADSSMTADSTIVSDTFSERHDNRKIHEFKNLINTNFNGFADAVKNNGQFQVFHFAELGRPRFIAPINMFPQQSVLYFNGTRMNDHINGMINTRFISLDQVESIRSAPADSEFTQRQYVDPLFYVTGRKAIYNDAYTRLKYYEGDFDYTDLDITFASKYSDDLTVRLAGFNKGYDGTVFNNQHTGVNYHADIEYKINPGITALFDFYLNHERSGMANGGSFRDFTFRGDDRSYALKFLFAADSLTGNEISAGLISKNTDQYNRSKIDSFNVANLSENYTVYVSKSLKTGFHNFVGTLSVDYHHMWGTPFKGNLYDTRYAVSLADNIILSEQSNLNLTTEIEQLNNKGSHINGGLNWQSRYSVFISGVNASILSRFPTPLEREYDYQQYEGNKKLQSEQIMKLEFVQNWFPFDFLMLKGQFGYNRVGREIIFKDDTFVNGSDRSWLYLVGESQLKVWDFRLSAGGHVLSAKKYISPKNMLWGQLAYHGIWFNKKIIIDASANANWYSRHDKMYYNPVVQRFYSGAGENASYMIFGFKLVGTVGNAEIFLEMDNFFKTEIKYIEGYYNSNRQVRFGVNWDLWK